MPPPVAQQPLNSSEGPSPVECELAHLFAHPSSVLSVAASSQHLFTGTLASYSDAVEAVINVWSLETYGLVKQLKGHSRSISNMCLSADQRFLFSSSKDGTVRVRTLFLRGCQCHVACCMLHDDVIIFFLLVLKIWSTEDLRCRSVLETPSNMGDVFSVTYLNSQGILAMACQNTSIMLVQLQDGVVVDSGGSSVRLDERSAKVKIFIYFYFTSPFALEGLSLRSFEH